MLGADDNANDSDGRVRLLNLDEESRNTRNGSFLLSLVRFNLRIAMKRNKFTQIMFPVLINIWIIIGLRGSSPDYVIPATKFSQTLDPVRGCIAGSKSVSFFCDATVLNPKYCDKTYETFMSTMDTFYWDINRYNDRIAYRESLLREGNTIGVQINSESDVDIDILNDAFPVLSQVEDTSGRNCHAFNDPNCAPITYVHSCASTIQIATLYSLDSSRMNEYRFRIFPQPEKPVNGIADSALIWIIPLYLSGLFLNMFNYALIELVSEKEGKHRDYLVSWGFTKLIHFQAWMISNTLVGTAAVLLMVYMLISNSVFSSQFSLHISIGCFSYFLSLLACAYILSVRVTNTRTASSLASFADLVFNFSSLSVAAIQNRFFALATSVIPTIPFFLLLRGIAYDEYSPNSNPLLSANDALISSMITCVVFVIGGASFINRDTFSPRSVSNETELVSITNLVKQYPLTDSIALKGIDFSINPNGQIVTVIGGNGAGKTTLIHTLLGILNPTSFDEFTTPSNSEICVCLQDDCFWESLTVMDHIQLFGLELGGGTSDPSLIDKYIDIFQLRESLDKNCGILSGGQKRRLSSLLAFLKSERSDARLLVLDEPTTGVDVAGRRIVWDQIRAAAKTRKKSVLLTTHYLDEARELSDKIVVLMHGNVKAEGSVTELQQIDGGFVFKFDGESVLDDFRKIIPEIFSRSENDLVIPQHVGSQKLKQLLVQADDLERLGVISNISLQSINLENLFDDNSLQHGQEQDDEIFAAPIVKIPTLTDQVYAMSRIRILPVISNWSTFFSTVIFPVLMISLSVFARVIFRQSAASSIPNVSDQFHFDINSFNDGFALKNVPAMIPILGNTVPDFIASLSPDFQPLSITSSSMMDFLFANSNQSFPFAIDTDRNEIWLNPENPRSGFAIVHQILAPNINLRISSHLPISEFHQAVISNVFNMAIYIVLSLTIVSSQCATFIFDERSSFIKRLAQIQGLKPLGYWIGSCVGHLAVYLPLAATVPVLATSVLGPVITDVPGYWLILPISGIINAVQLILFGYFFVFWFSSKESMLKYNSLALLVFAELVVGAGTMLILLGKDPDGIYGLILSLVSPYFSVSGTVAHIAKLRLDSCSPVTETCDWSNGYTLFPLVSCMLGALTQIALLVAILVFKERDDVRRLLEPSFDTPWGIETCEGRELVDHSVVRERERVLKTPGNTDDVLIVKLWHSYPQSPPGWRSLLPSRFDSKKNPLVPRLSWAVKDLTLGIPRNQVLGLLGENGAGKSTAISILLGVTKAVAGYAGITRGCRIGFCPQVNALWDKLSGIEHIRFYSSVRGAWVDDMHARQLLSMVGLGEDAHCKKTREYSGGMKRRLCLAIALIGDPDVLILDEPTAGVDIAGKREMWKIIKRMCREGCSVLITTHSLEEADNLCNRIAIMNHGQLIKVGTTNELKKEQQKIFVTIVETQDKRPLTPTGATSSMDAIVRASLGTLAVKPRSKDKENIHEYEIDLKFTKLSEVVALLAELKESKIAEDFYISQLSLEDLFLNTIGRQPSEIAERILE